MAEHVLAYNHSIAPQEKSWDCGPASTQIVLDSCDIAVTEADLIAEIGTTTNGTDDISWIETRSLDRRLPDANYTRVYLTNDPPTAVQTATLWSNIVRSINAGYGVVMNWVSPPSNRPRGIKGSTSPNYGSRTVYHYVACMGYDDQARALWIADPGFSPFGYWISLDNAASLIPPKGYCYANVVTASDRPAKVLADATGLDFDRAATLLPAIRSGLVAANCTTPNRIAMWLAQIGHESANFKATEEYASGAEYEGRTDLGNTQRGDGIRFKGRTWIQITGRNNYGAFSRWAEPQGICSTATYFVDHPAELAELQYAGVGAAWYWTVARPTINALSDARDIVAVTKLINGGTNGLTTPGGRQDRYNRALAVGDALTEILTDQGDSFMSALTDTEQRELLELARQIASYRRNSLSMFAHLGEGPVNTCAGFSWSADGLIHPLFTAWAAKYGHEESISLLGELAGADLTKYPEKASAARVAANILAELEANNKDVLENYLTNMKGI